MSEIRHEATTLLHPGNADEPHWVDVPGEIPCYTILVHGVNDLCEPYPAMEAGICAGLNERLYRHRPGRDPASGELRPNTYNAPDPARLVDDPDGTFNQLTPSGRSPVIPFRWGYKEATERIQIDKYSGQSLDQYGNRVARDGTKAGGPFANAVTSLPDMWAGGFRSKVLGFIDLNWGADSIHPLRDCPPRDYSVLAAQRLAALVAIIRKRYVHAPVNIVAHSQGCNVALLAMACLHQWGLRPADTLILNNAPYSLHHFVTLTERLGLTGLRLQTPRARVRTLANIVRFVGEQPGTVPPLADLRKHRIAGAAWEPARDRDNRGKVYLYFLPEDQTVGMSSPSGIGWQGIPDQTPNSDRTLIPALPELGPTFHQRVFTRRRRDGKGVRVGEPPGGAGDGYFTLWKEGEPFWDRDLGWLREVFASGTFEKDNRIVARRRITHETLPQPFVPDLGTDLLPVSPMDAATAVTNGGQYRTTDADGDEVGMPLIREDIRDPRPPDYRAMDCVFGGRRGEASDRLGPAELRHLQDLLNQGRADKDKVELVSAQDAGHGNLAITRRESAEEARLRWQTREHLRNSFHSAIVMNPEHHRRATAYDLSLGWTSVSDKEWNGDRRAEDEAFWQYLRDVADWRIPVKKLQDAEDGTAAFAEADLADERIGPVLRANDLYCQTGRMDAGVVKAEPPPLVVDEAVARLEPLGQRDRH